MSTERTIVCLDTKEVVKTYEDYLQTRHWKKLRFVVAEKAEHLCRKCKNQFLEGFHVHHVTYARIGRERMSDLWFMCEECHNKYHDTKKKKKRKQQPKCKYCHVPLVNDGVVLRCPRCEYYERPLNSGGKPVVTNRKKLAIVKKEQQAIYDKLKREFERDSKESPKLQ